MLSTRAVIDPSRHEGSRNPIEAILQFVPGFRGYLKKEDRRESDHLARTWLADRLQRCKTSFDEYQRRLVDAGQIDHLPQCERVRSRLDALASRIRGAVRGYSGFFDFVQVDDQLLEQVYRHDMFLVSEVEVLSRVIDELGSTTEPPSEAAAGLLQRIEQLERYFDQRGALLQGVGPES